MQDYGDAFAGMVVAAADTATDVGDYAAAEPNDPADWAFEPKLDGWRALVYVDGAVMVRTRTGRDVTANRPSPRARGARPAARARRRARRGRGPGAGILPARWPNAIERQYRRCDVRCVRRPGARRRPRLRLVVSTSAAALESLGLLGAAWCTIRSLNAKPRELPWWLCVVTRLHLARLLRRVRNDTRYVPVAERPSDDDGLRMLVLATRAKKHHFRLAEMPTARCRIDRGRRVQRHPFRREPCTGKRSPKTFKRHCRPGSASASDGPTPPWKLRCGTKRRASTTHETRLPAS